MAMRTRAFLQMLLVSILAVVLCPSARADAASEKTRIEGLIRHVESLQDAKFVRNGKSYDAKSAARFLRGKWQSKDKEIKTAEDFIAKAATVSSTSGKPYLIKFNDGREVKCGDYLTERLKKEKP